MPERYDPALYDGSRFHPLAAVCAFIFPGAGHLVLGETKRAVLVSAGVLGLFFGGLFIGGVDVVDAREDRLWFFAQAAVGPIAFATNYAHQNHLKAIDPVTKRLRSGYPDEIRVTRDPGSGAPLDTPQWLVNGTGSPPSTKSVAKVNEVGTLYAALAGFMNFIAIIDAAFPGGRRRKAHKLAEAADAAAIAAVTGGAAGATP